MGYYELTATGAVHDEGATVIYDSWDLNTLREAAEYNAANPDPEFVGAELWVKDRLAEAEAQRLHVTAVAVADEVPATRRPSDGSTNYGATTGASEAQERFIRSLCAERGIDADALLATIKDKRAASAAIDRLKAQPRKEQARPATERQVEFLTDLLATRVHAYGDDAAEVLGLVAGKVTFDAASALISALLDSPKVAGAKPAHGIRHGRYAFQPADGSPAQFYRVGQNGRIYVQAGPAEHPYNGKLNEALEAIKADPQAGAALYGQLIGACGRCGIALTDETSRAAGLGPVCATKTDW